MGAVRKGWRPYGPRTTDMAFACVKCGNISIIPQTRDIPLVCPHCGETVEKVKCTLCGHEWTPMYSTFPKNCLRCKSKYWNRPRTKKNWNNPRPDVRERRTKKYDIENV